jgi:hypothetical protein
MESLTVPIGEEEFLENVCQGSDASIGNVKFERVSPDVRHNKILLQDIATTYLLKRRSLR